MGGTSVSGEWPRGTRRYLLAIYVWGRTGIALALAVALIAAGTSFWKTRQYGRRAADLFTRAGRWLLFAPYDDSCRTYIKQRCTYYLVECQTLRISFGLPYAYTSSCP